MHYNGGNSSQKFFAEFLLGTSLRTRAAKDEGVIFVEWFRTIGWTIVTIGLFFTGIDAYSSNGYMEFFGFKLTQPLFIALIIVFLAMDVYSIIRLINAKKAE